MNLEPSNIRLIEDTTININGQEVYLKSDDKYKRAVLDMSTGKIYLPKESDKICPFLSDDKYKQPCIEGPCTHEHECPYKEAENE